MKLIKVGSGIRLLNVSDYGAGYAAGAAGAIGISAPGNVDDVTAPSLSGNPYEGATVTTAPGTWYPAADSYAYAYDLSPSGSGSWTPVSGETLATIDGTAAMEGLYLRGRVTPANAGGTGNEHATSNALGPFIAIPYFTANPAITGTATVGETLTCDGGTVGGGGTISRAYQWQADSVDISGATSATYELTATELGASVTCDVTPSNAAGTGTETASNALGPVASATTVMGITRAARVDDYASTTVDLPASGSLLVRFIITDWDTSTGAVAYVGNSTSRVYLFVSNTLSVPGVESQVRSQSPSANSDSVSYTRHDLVDGTTEVRAVVTWGSGAVNLYSSRDRGWVEPALNNPRTYTGTVAQSSVPFAMHITTTGTRSIAGSAEAMLLSRVVSEAERNAFLQTVDDAVGDLVGDASEVAYFAAADSATEGGSIATGADIDGATWSLTSGTARLTSGGLPDLAAKSVVGAIGQSNALGTSTSQSTAVVPGRLWTYTGSAVFEPRKFEDIGATGAEEVYTTTAREVPKHAVPNTEIQEWLDTYLDEFIALCTLCNRTVPTIVWRQGENDAGDSAKAAAYQGKLETLVTRCRDELGTTLFIIPELFGLPGGYTYESTINAAYNAATVAGVTFEVFDNSTAEKDVDDVHFTRAGHNTTGALIEAILTSYGR